MQPSSGHARCIVVGYDGSPAAEAAVSYAVGRTRGGGSTVVVHAIEAASEERHEHGQAVLDALVMEHGEELFEGDFETTLRAGAPADAILAAARERGADEIVVGSRGLGRTRALLGSVSHELISKADRPLVVIPRGGED